MAFTAPGLYSRVRQLLPEVLKFGLVGGIGTVVDVGGAAVLLGKYHFAPLEAKAISITVATMITYLGSRFWTFKDRENQDLKREAVLFIVLNLVGLLIAEAVVGFVTYIMSLHGQLEYNIASFFGTGFGTVFRYFAYKKWVFLAPGEQAGAAAAAPAAQPFLNYPPWELDPAFLGTVPAPVVSPASAAPLAAPAYASSRSQQPASIGTQQPAQAWGQQPAWDQQPAPAWGQQPASIGTQQPAQAWNQQPAQPWNQPLTSSSWDARAAETIPFPPSVPPAPAPAPAPAPVRGSRRPAPAATAAPRSSGGRHRKT